MVTHIALLVLPPTSLSLQEEGVNQARKMMEVENYQVDAVRGRLGEVLDEFIENLE